MKIFPFSIFMFISINCIGQTPPYQGTIFIESNILSSSDSSAYESVNYIEQADKLVFDRRVNDWVTINAFLFEVTWSDGLLATAIINPEFNSVEQAEMEAIKYGHLIGQLPNCLRVDVNEIWIHKGVELFGGGNNSILIHTDQTVLYENDLILEETLIHEAVHTSLDANHSESLGWKEAQRLDANFISTYARDNPKREDLAETVLLWLAAKYRKDRIAQESYDNIVGTIPNRLEYLDNIQCDLFPFVISTTTSTKELEEIVGKISLYPNPTSNLLSVNNIENRELDGHLYDLQGQLVIKNVLSSKGVFDMTSLSNGIYFLKLVHENRSNLYKIVKH